MVKRTKHTRRRRRQRRKQVGAGTGKLNWSNVLPGGTWKPGRVASWANATHYARNKKSLTGGPLRSCGSRGGYRKKARRRTRSRRRTYKGGVRWGWPIVQPIINAGRYAGRDFADTLEGVPGWNGSTNLEPPGNNDPWKY